MKKKILIIEDDKILREALIEALTSANYEFASAVDGDEGVKKAKSEKPDLILLDLMLPGKNGYNVLLDLSKSEELKKIPVIVLTVLDSEYSLETCKLAGAKDYLIKSEYSLAEIVKKVRQNL